MKFVNLYPISSRYEPGHASPTGGKHRNMVKCEDANDRNTKPLCGGLSALGGAPVVRAGGVYDDVLMREGELTDSYRD